MSYQTLHTKLYKGMLLVVNQIELYKGIPHHLCGYVGVDNNHALYGLDYACRLDPTIIDINTPIGDRGTIASFVASFRIDKYATIYDLFDVHGSLTYSSNQVGWHSYPTLSDFWFFGFDCNHLDDTLHNWPLKRVIKETKRLADQLHMYKDADIKLYTETEVIDNMH